MKNIIITILFGILLYILYLPPHVCHNKYDALIKELQSVRTFNFQICFTKQEVRHRESYCQTYDTLDVLLHFEGQKYE